MFRGDDAKRLANAAPFVSGEGISGRNVIFLLTLIALLVAGTLKIDLLTAQLMTFTVALPQALPAQQLLDRLLPVDAIKGNEGLSLQGVILIFLLMLIGVTAIRGLGKVDEGLNWLTILSLGLIVTTLLFAAMAMGNLALCLPNFPSSDRRCIPRWYHPVIHPSRMDSGDRGFQYSTW